MKAALVDMTVLSLAADERLIDLDNAAQLGLRFDQSGTDFLRHEPSGFDRPETHVAAKLASARTLLTGQDEVGNLEPVAKRLVGVLKDRPGQMQEPIAVHGALLALPMIPGGKRVTLAISATRAFDAIGPAAGDQILDTGILIADWKHRGSNTDSTPA